MSDTSPTITHESLKDMMREVIVAVLPEYLDGIPKAKDILELHEAIRAMSAKLDKAASQEDIKELRQRVDQAENSLTASQNDHKRLVERMDETEYKNDKFMQFIKDSVLQIERGVADTNSQLNRRDEQYHGRFQSIDKRVSDVDQTNVRQTEAIAANASDIDGLRQRITEFFNPVHSFIMGDDTRPPLNDTLTRIQSDIAINNTNTQAINAKLVSLENAEKARQEFWQGVRDFVRTPIGKAAVSGGTVLFFALFSRIDLTQIIALVQTIAGVK